MQNQNSFTQFGKSVRARGIFGIFTATYAIFFMFLSNLLPRFGIYLIPITSSFFMIMGWLGLILLVVDLILILLVIIAANSTRYYVQHIHFSQFYSRFLISFYLAIFNLVYIIGYNIALPLFFSIEDTIIAMEIASVIGSIITIIENIIIFTAWAYFLRFTKLQKFPDNTINSSNLIKTGYMLMVISSIFGFFSQVFSLLVISGFSFGYYIGNIIGYSLLIASVLFTIIIPIFLITGKIQLGSSIQLVSYNRSEPTLGKSSNFQANNKKTQNNKICPNCGIKILHSANFCPNCGNSI
ncbi:MAG: zinc ribbon domain-containing protein [Candidatus Lokiarchaeota archaeon]|nr:zinc ribbon domain-containing protein [Candidatus Lokiarchaeota archaeon]